MNTTTMITLTGHEGALLLEAMGHPGTLEDAIHHAVSWFVAYRLKTQKEGKTMETRRLWQGKVTDRTTGHSSLTYPCGSRQHAEEASRRLAVRRGIKRQDIEVVELHPQKGGDS